MLVLALQTDRPEATLLLLDNEVVLAEHNWDAHRALARTLNRKIEEILKSQELNLVDIEGIAFYKGPGSFTGLRIGASVANALSASYNIPVVGVSGEDWLKNAVQQLAHTDPEPKIIPEYGMPAHTTQQKR